MRLVLLASVLLIAACAERRPPPLAPATPEASIGTCCPSTEPAIGVPQWVTTIVEAIPERLVASFTTIDLRPGRFSRQPEAQAIVLTALEPLDILLVTVGGRVSGLLTPGYFDHAVIYLGTEAELRARGLWDDPAVAPFRDRFAAGPVFLQAIPGGVRAGGAEMGLADAVTVLRPPISAMALPGRLRQALGYHGRPFDHDFDAESCDRIFCTELVAVLFPDLGVPDRVINGRRTYLPDDIALAALRGEVPVAFIGHVEAFPGGWRATTARDLALRLERAWAP